MLRRVQLPVLEALKSRLHNTVGKNSRTIVSGTTNGVPWFNSHCGSLFRHMPNTCWTLIPLGTSSAVPSPRRNVTSSYLRMLSNGYLFDAGEATFGQMRACYLCSLRSLRRVFITHMHGDHVFGLPSILMYALELARTYDANGRNLDLLPRLQVYGPVGLYSFLRTAFLPAGRKAWETMPIDIFEIVAPDQLDFGTAEGGDRRGAGGGRGRPLVSMAANHYFVRPESDGTYNLVDEKDHTVRAAPLRHSISCYGYVVHEKEKRHMLPELMARRGIPPGRIYSDVQKGRPVVAPDGTTVRWEDVSYPSGPGRKVVVLGDNCDASKIVPLAMNADIVSHESTIVDGDRAKAIARGHATPEMAGEFGAAVNAKTLLLTHFSSSFGCGAREASIHWLGRSEVSNLMREAREGGVRRRPRTATTAPSSGVSAGQVRAEALAETAQAGGLPILHDADDVDLLRVNTDVETFLPVGYTFAQAYTDGLLETDRVYVDAQGGLHSRATSVDSNVLDILDKTIAGVPTRADLRAIQLPTCSFPHVEDSSETRSIARRAGNVLGSKVQVIAARDFMALPLLPHEAPPPNSGGVPAPSLAARAVLK